MTDEKQILERQISWLKEFRETAADMYLPQYPAFKSKHPDAWRVPVKDILQTIDSCLACLEEILQEETEYLEEEAHLDRRHETNLAWSA